MKKKSFSERLRQGLELTDTKPAELSRLTGISKSSISHYLKGDWEGKQDAVYKIARALNVSEAWLMGFDAPIERDDKAITTGIAKSDVNNNIIKIASRDGSYTERKLTDDQLDLIKKMIDQMANAEDL